MAWAMVLASCSALASMSGLASGGQTGPQSPVNAAAMERLLAAVPQEAAFVMVVESPERFRTNPVVISLLPVAGDLEKLHAASAPVIAGPVVFALIAAPGASHGLRPLVIAQLRADADSPMQRLRDSLARALNQTALAATIGRCRVEAADEDSFSLVFDGGFPELLFARRGQELGATTERGVLEAFRADRPAEPSFARRQDAAWCLLSPFSADDLAVRPAPRVLCGISFTVLETAVDGPIPRWPFHATPEIESVMPASLVVAEYGERLRIAWTGSSDTGLFAALPGGAVNRRTLADFYPPDVTFMVSSALPDAPGWEGVARATTVLAPMSGTAQDAAEWLKSVSGIDLPPGLVPRPRERFAFGGRLSEAGVFESGLLAFAVADAERLRGELAEFRRRPGAGVVSNALGDFTIEHWRTAAGRIYSTLIIDDVLLIADEPHTLVAVIEARGQQRTLDGARFFPSLTPRLPPADALLATVELQTLLRTMPPDWHSRLDDVWRRFARNHPSLVLTALPLRNGVGLDVVSAPSVKGGWSDVWEASRAEFVRVRGQARRMKSMLNLRNIALSVWQYAQDHEGQAPPSLQALEDGKYLGAESLACPYPDVHQAAGAEAFYVLAQNVRRPGDIQAASDKVLAGERVIHHGGAAFVFVDGHAEWIASPKAEALLAELMAGP